MTTASAQRARYAGTALATASPQVLLLRLYDRLSLDLQRAAEAQTAGDHVAANQLLQHGQAIVSALATALDLDAWDGAERLKSLYTWLIQEMVRANTGRDATRTRACSSVVEPLRSAWHEAQASLTGGVSEVVAPPAAPHAVAPQPAAPAFLQPVGPVADGARSPLPAARAGTLGAGPVAAAALLRARTLAAAGAGHSSGGPR